MRQQYRVWIILAIVALLVAGCDGGQNQPQAVFNTYNAQTVLDGLKAAGLSVSNERRDMAVAPDIPVTFSERYLFEIDKIAPAGGQVLIFNSRENLDSWQAYINRQRNNSATRRNFVYVYNKANALLILSPELTVDDASAYQTAFERLP